MSKTNNDIDLGKARAETPGVEQRLHFNNAGAGLMPQMVLDAMVSHLQLEARIGGYEAADASLDKIERVYDALATLLNCSRDEIGVVENATRAWDMAFYSLKFKPGDRILTAVSEYASNFIPFLQIQKKCAVTVDVVPNDKSGQLDVNALGKMIDEKVKLIAITHVPTNGGLVNPAKEIGKVARAHGITFLLDACQSVGQMPIDVQEIGCDILTATGRKYLRGPRATGFLYVRQDLIEALEPPLLDLHAAEWESRTRYSIRSDARRFENWETNYAGKIGLAVAVDYALSWGLTAIERRVSHLAALLRAQLASIPDIAVQDIGAKKCGIVTFNSSQRSSAQIKEQLAGVKINVSVSTPSSTLIDMQERGLGELVRASVHYYNSEDEIDQFVSTLQRFAAS